jgi:hypothetical protein
VFPIADTELRRGVLCRAHRLRDPAWTYCREVRRRRADLRPGPSGNILTQMIRNGGAATGVCASNQMMLDLMRKNGYAWW